MTFKLFFDRINTKAKVKGNKYEKKDYESALRTRCAERTRATQLVCVCASYYLHRTFHGNLCPGRHGGASPGYTQCPYAGKLHRLHGACALNTTADIILVPDFYRIRYSQVSRPDVRCPFPSPWQYMLSFP